MTIIHLDPLGTTTSLSLTSTVEDLADSIDNKTATVTTVGATIVTALSNPRQSYCDVANRYLDSLSNNQLFEMDRLLQEKEDSIALTFGDNIIEFDKPKVYTK